MVWTADCAAHDALAAEQPASAMPAEVQMRVQPVLAADEDDAFTRHVEHTIGAHTRYLLCSAGVKPLVPKNRFSFARKECLVPIRGPRKRGLKCDNFRRFHRLIYQMPK